MPCRERAAGPAVNKCPHNNDRGAESSCGQVASAEWSVLRGHVLVTPPIKYAVCQVNNLLRGNPVCQTAERQWRQTPDPGVNQLCPTTPTHTITTIDMSTYKHTNQFLCSCFSQLPKVGSAGHLLYLLYFSYLCVLTVVYLSVYVFIYNYVVKLIIYTYIYINPKNDFLQILPSEMV